MRIAITGAGGLLGRALLHALPDSHDIIAAFHSAEIHDRKYLEQYPLDLDSEDSIRRFVERANADLIIHSAAVTDVDLCEREPGLAQRLNADGTRRFVEAIRGSATRILYISTDYVFDGTSGPYAETDPTAPLNVYGKTKLDGELTVLSLAERGTVVRSASFLGHGNGDRRTFAERMLEIMRDNPPLHTAIDQCSNITPVDELASGIMRVVDAGASGVWHIAHPDIMSRFELATLIAQCAGIDTSYVRKASYDSLHRAAARPLRGGLMVTKAQDRLGISFRPLAESVNLFVAGA